VRKPLILVACPPFALPRLEQVLGSCTEIVAVHSLPAAHEALEGNPGLEVVLCGVHFAESHMFDLLTYSRQRFPGLPFICVRIPGSEIPRISREAMGEGMRGAR
jgi:hypothetical protein